MSDSFRFSSVAPATRRRRAAPVRLVAPGVRSGARLRRLAVAQHRAGSGMMGALVMLSGGFILQQRGPLPGWLFALLLLGACGCLLVALGALLGRGANERE